MARKAPKLPVFGATAKPGLVVIVGGAGYNFGCGTCGRRWDMPYGGYAVGFVKAAANTHTWRCARLTPQERRKQNARDERRWAKTPPKNATVYNMPDHPGLRE